MESDGPFSDVPLQTAFGAWEFLSPEALWLYYVGVKGWVSAVKGAMSKPVSKVHSTGLRGREEYMGLMTFPHPNYLLSSDIPSLCPHGMSPPPALSKYSPKAFPQGQL